MAEFRTQNVQCSGQRKNKIATSYATTELGILLPQYAGPDTPQTWNSGNTLEAQNRGKTMWKAWITRTTAYDWSTYSIPVVA